MRSSMMSLRTTKPSLKSIAKISKARQTEIVTLPHRYILACLQDITIDHESAVQELDALMVNASPSVSPPLAPS